MRRALWNKVIISPQLITQRDPCSWHPTPQCPPCSSMLGRMSTANPSNVLRHNETPHWGMASSWLCCPCPRVPRALLLLKWSAMLRPHFRSFLSKHPATTAGPDGLKGFFQPKRLYDSTKPLFMEFIGICTWSLFPALLKGAWETGKTQEAICWKLKICRRTNSILTGTIDSVNLVDSLAGTKPAKHMAWV